MLETIEKHKTDNQLPDIPHKRYFTIGEVSELCHVKPHVLRYWEQEFQMLRPSKRRGNRRYYQHKDVVLIRQIRGLLYDQGFTIEGARGQLSAQKTDQPSSPKDAGAIDSTILELEDILRVLVEL